MVQNMKQGINNTVDEEIYDEEVVYEEIDNTTMLHKVIRMAVCIAIPVAVGLISSLATRNAMREFESLNKPFLAPPAILFPIAWTILYILMGIGSYFILYSNSSDRYLITFVYGVQLFFNLLWSPLFFLGKAYWFSFVWLLVMMFMIAYIIRESFKVSKIAFVCFIPYMAWCIFAAYLNAGVAILN